MADSVRPARIHPQRLNQIFGCRDQDVYSTVHSSIESLRMTGSDAVMPSALIPVSLSGSHPSVPLAVDRTRVFQTTATRRDSVVHHE